MHCTVLPLSIHLMTVEFMPITSSDEFVSVYPYPSLVGTAVGEDSSRER